jgi:hypothetical protein
VKLQVILSVVCFIQLSEAGVLFVSLKMGKIEYRAVIKFFVKQGLTPNEIHSKFAGQRFSSNQEAIAAVEGYFADLTKNHYRDGIMTLEHCWNKCISLKRDYVRK